MSMPESIQNPMNNRYSCVLTYPHLPIEPEEDKSTERQHGGEKVEDSAFLLRIAAREEVAQGKED